MSVLMKQGEESGMGRWETIQPSSARRETRAEHRPKAVGCMSGIFHFLSRHHNHSRKRLTSAKRKEKTIVAPSKLTASLDKPPLALPVKYELENKTELWSRSFEGARSPMIPPEIRLRPSPVNTGSLHSPRRPPVLVARLMGLEEAAPVEVSSPESAAEKRRKLLGALEKCDEDLKTLKRIIEAIRLAETKTKAVMSSVGSVESNGRFELNGWVSKMECNGEQPIPVSVLNQISSPRYRSKRSNTGKPNKSRIAAVRSRIVKPSRMAVFLGDPFMKVRSEYDDNYLVYRRMAMEGLPGVHQWRELKEKMEGCRRRQWWRKRRLSQAMMASVGEVWEEGLLEERSEPGRVGAVLEGGIFRDLVEELVSELLDHCYQFAFGLRTCRKRLCF